MALKWSLRVWNFSNFIAKKCRFLITARLFSQNWWGVAFPHVTGGGIAGFFEIFWRIFLIFWKTGKNLLDFRINFIDVFHSGVKLLLRLVLILSILGKFSRTDARPTVDGSLHIVIIDDRLLHLSYLAENRIFFFSVTASVGQVVIFFVSWSSVFTVPHTQIHEVFTFNIIFQCALLEPVDCEGLFQVVVSEGWCCPVMVNAVLCILSNGWTGEDFAVLAFFQTIDPFASWGCIIFFFDFFDSLVGLAGLQFRVTVEVWEIVALAGGVALLVGDVGETVIFHTKQLTNFYYQNYWYYL